jgi:uncharacterized membrane protein YeaQ/YmgE (transglycosylase-associated protein family)
MGVFGWIVIGFLAGLAANKLLNRCGEKATIEIVLGIAGAAIGGWLFSRFGSDSATGLRLWDLVVPAAGAMLLLVVWHAARSAILRA